MARKLFHLLRAAQPSGSIVSDSELLRRHRNLQDEAALELLIRRHADAVWTACRRVLGSDADSEDAFQTAFLLLVRHGGSIRGCSVGAWLHRVAVNASLKLKARQLRSQPSEHVHQILSTTEPPEAAVVRNELAAIVHQELARLPERYRLPVVLCDMEGLTHAEAAAMLDWPVGSVSGRLSRAHAVLRDRLARRGLAMSTVGTVLTATAPPAQAIETLRSICAGVVSPSPSVSDLLQGVSSAMKTAQLKLVIVATVVPALVALAGIGTAWALSGDAPPAAESTRNTEAPAAEPPLEGDWLPKKDTDSPPSAFPHVGAIDWKEHNGNVETILAKRLPLLFGENSFPVARDDDTYRRLLKARLYQCTREYHRLCVRLQIGAFQPDDLTSTLRLQVDMRSVVAELWQGDRKELARRLEELLVIANDLVQFTRARVKIGTDPVHRLHTVERHRLEVEAVLWKTVHPK